MCIRDRIYVYDGGELDNTSGTITNNGLIGRADGNSTCGTGIINPIGGGTISPNSVQNGVCPPFP